ncbi:hypothetical protein BU26DRAFT_270221 [Trematosphaeria pertusa]|uniref:UROD/MetE-like protein n=1 Tax=Trematosphaeria pertusa TaxID=390896 RepID=A0A6A6IML5_9PLEO|nr:uncharacterized protein BU26DRAFT_270221 [Trematosphaeria pertusa]KAF2250800.1 hypothetical protein BU26DRAFT_270221 [Trematosphaeria pertusa]
MTPDTTTSPKPTGVHLVGSICGTATSASAFYKALTSFPNRLRRLPDGEPAHRSTFVGWQMGVFAHTPDVLRKYDDAINCIQQAPVPVAEVTKIVANMPPLEPGYDDAALESYAEFKKLKEEGKIPKGARFQVCLPTVFCVICLIREGFQEPVEPVYEEALLGCLRRIEEVVPSEELAVQWDIAGEPMTLEGAFRPHFEPWFAKGESREVLLDEIVGRIARLVGKVKQGAEVGMHICYGDWGHKHFVEPKDTGLMVEIAKGVIDRAERKVQWVHMPVPKSRDDEAYFLPLKDFGFEETELYLGLVHANDREGTDRRLKTAQDVLGGRNFGIATECGLGRTPVEDLAEIAEICCDISAPVT